VITALRAFTDRLLGRGDATITVPSQLIPANPVAMRSMTPSKTEVITTSAKTPSMRSVRVSVERSLCAQSSTNPPRITSP